MTYCCLYQGIGDGLSEYLTRILKTLAILRQYCPEGIRTIISKNVCDGIWINIHRALGLFRNVCREADVRKKKDPSANQKTTRWATEHRGSAGVWRGEKKSSCKIHKSIASENEIRNIVLNVADEQRSGRTMAYTSAEFSLCRKITINRITALDTLS